LKNNPDNIAPFEANVEAVMHISTRHFLRSGPSTACKRKGRCPRPGPQSCQQLYASGKTQAFELQMVRDDGSRLWVSVTTNISHSYSPTGAATLRVMLMDISERHQLALALLAKNTALALARHRAESACRAKSDFLTSMSHELSAPLKALLVFAQLVETGTPAPTAAQQSALAQILQGGWQALGLVNEVRELASLESGQAALRISHEFLADVLLHCQTVIAPQADAAGIAVSFPLFTQPCRVQADRQRLAQVLLNLLSNAIKTSQPYGKVVVRWSLRPEQRVRISVRDSGPGLSAEQLARLFEPFGHPTPAQSAGCGMELVVSQRLVELMGGQRQLTAKRLIASKNIAACAIGTVVASRFGINSRAYVRQRTERITCRHLSSPGIGKTRARVLICLRLFQ